MKNAYANAPLASSKGDSAVAARGIPCYWIVNLIDGVIEVHTDPDPTGGYHTQTDFRRGGQVPVVIGGREIGRIDVAELLT